MGRVGGSEGSRLMPTVLHIDGGGKADRFEIKRGESLADVLNTWGVTWTARDIERIPTAPKLSREGAAFIASYEREDPSAVLAVFWRYHSLEAEEFDSVEEAERFLEGGEDYGTLAGEAVVDGDRINVRD